MKHGTLTFVAMVALVLIGCGSEASSGAAFTGPPEGFGRLPEDVTTEEALALLEQAQAFALARDLEGLCGMRWSTDCSSSLLGSDGWDAVPEKPPKVVGSFVKPTQFSSTEPGNYYAGGRVLTLEGVDGLGRPFRGDFAVRFDRTSQRVEPSKFVYWTNTRQMSSLSAGKAIELSLTAVAGRAALSKAALESAGRLPEDVTVEEATEVLERTRAFVDASDSHGLCEMARSDAVCKTMLQGDPDWNLAPMDQPEVVDTFVIPTARLHSGGYEPGGRVLVVEGVDGLGQRYRGHFKVYFDVLAQRLVPLTPVYWMGIQFPLPGPGIDEPDS